MILAAFTLLHVAISLTAIAAGFAVVAGLLTSKRSEGWTSLFLITTVLTSVTGFFFPVHHFMPSHAIGILLLMILALAILARYRYRLVGGWGRTYAITAVAALYLNVFVLIVQLFMKVPALKAIAPTQSEPPFQMAQLVVLLLFTAVGVRAAIKSHDEPHGMVRT